MKKDSFNLRKSFTILMMLVVIFGCIFSNVSALGEEDAGLEESAEVSEAKNEDTDHLSEASDNDQESTFDDDSSDVSGDVDIAVPMSITTDAEMQNPESAGPISESISDDVNEAEPVDQVDTASASALPMNGGVLSLSSDSTLSGGQDGSWAVVCDDSDHSVDDLDYVIVNGDFMITLDSFALASTNGPAIAVESGNVTIELVGSSSLQGALGCAGIYVAPGASLTITGSGSLHARGGDYRSTKSASGPGYLKNYIGVESAAFYFSGAAGIGGNGMVAYASGRSYVSDVLPSFGTVSITSGEVVAEGGIVANGNMGSGAGIGAGGMISVSSKESSLTGQVFISGGSVTATGGTGIASKSPHGGAGIGSGGTSGGFFSQNSIEIYIAGGDVCATGGYYAAGIGGGNNVYGGPIEITGGSVKAFAGTASNTIGGAGIGGGENAGAKSIVITGGTVEAYGSGSGAGIGAGNAGGMPYLNASNEREYMTIAIAGDARVTAYGGSGKDGCLNGGSGIGLGAKLDDWGYAYNLGFASISISDNAMVRAYAGPGAQAIGMGTDYNGNIYQPSSSKLMPSDSISFNGSNIDVWMFTSDTTQGAFYGQSTDDPGVLSDSVTFTGCNGVWHTEGGSSSDDLYVSDAKYEGEFGWTEEAKDDGSSTIYVDFLGVPTVHENNAGYQGNWAAVNAHEPESAVTLTPVSITSYVGGTSASGNDMPVLRFDVDTAAAGGVDPANLTYELYTQYRTPSATCGHEDELVCERVTATKASSSGSYYTFDALEADMGGVEDVGTVESETPAIDTTCQKSAYLKLVDTVTGEGMDSLHAGVYRIMLRTNATTHWENWYLVATDKTTGDKYLVKIDAPSTMDEVASDDATVTVRFVSTEEEMYAYTDEGKDQDQNESVILTKVQSATERGAIDTSSGAVAVVDAGTNFTTNGDSNLGLFGASNEDENANALLPTYVDENEAKIALLFDDVLPDGVAGAAGSEGLANLLEEKMPDINLSEYEAEYKYLDLVNFADGNAQVTADQDVTVYWPYPDGVTYETAQGYEFRIIHYKGLEREYMTGDNSADEVEELEVEATPYGLKFKTDSFSPFALLWQEKAEVPGDPTETSGGSNQVVSDDSGQDEPVDETAGDTNESDAVVVTPLTGTTVSPSTYDATFSVVLLGSLAAMGAGLAALGFGAGQKGRKR